MNKKLDKKGFRTKTRVYNSFFMRKIKNVFRDLIFSPRLILIEPNTLNESSLKALKELLDWGAYPIGLYLVMCINDLKRSFAIAVERLQKIEVQFASFNSLNVEVKNLKETTTKHERQIERINNFINS